MTIANTGKRFGLQIVFVCLYITLQKACQIYFVGYVSRLSIFSQWSNTQYIGLGVCSLPISSVVIEIIYTYYHHQIGIIKYYPLFRVRSWHNGMRCLSLKAPTRFKGATTLEKQPNLIHPPTSTESYENNNISFKWSHKQSHNLFYILQLGPLVMMDKVFIHREFLHVCTIISTLIENRIVPFSPNIYLKVVRVSGGYEASMCGGNPVVGIVTTGWWIVAKVTTHFYFCIV